MQVILDSGTYYTDLPFMKLRHELTLHFKILIFEYPILKITHMKQAVGETAFERSNVITRNFIHKVDSANVTTIFVTS